MSLSTLGGLLESVPPFQRLTDSLGRRRASVRVQVLAEAVPFVLSTLWKGVRLPVLVIAPRPEDARRLHEQLAVWSAPGQTRCSSPRPRRCLSSDWLPTSTPPISVYGRYPR